MKTQNSKKHFTEEELLYLKEHYHNTPTRDIAKYLDRSYTSVNRKCGRLGLKKDFKGKYQQFIKHDYFSCWSHDMAYILGFITADGCVFQADKRSNRCRLRIQLHIKDVQILEKVKEEICRELPIMYGKSYDKRFDRTSEWCVLQLNSVKIIEDLRRYGIVIRKSGKEILPDIPQKFFGDWLRGLTDGDGCWSYYLHNGKPKCSYVLCSSSIDFLHLLRSRLACGYVYNSYTDRKAHTWHVVERNELRKIFNVLYCVDGYEHNRFCLKRKKDKILKFFESIE